MKLPRLNSDVDIGSGILKQKPEDFLVEEIPSYLPSGEGEHLYLWVEKRDVSALELMRRMARILGVNRNQIGMAGMKDRQAITRQWISVPASKNIDFDDDHRGDLDENIKILAQKRHTNKIKTGHLKGNKFTILVREPTGSFETISKSVAILNATGIPNFYGLQRFGIDNQTLEMGRKFVLREEFIREKRLRRFVMSAVQSAVFNAVLRERMKRLALGRALVGDIFAQLEDEGSKRCTTENLEESTRRVQQKMCIPTGPMPGVKMTRAGGEVGEMEDGALEEFGLSWDDFLGLEKIARGTRRPLICRPLTPIVVNNVDEGFQFVFSLPSGSYATVALRQLIDFKDGETEYE